MAVVVRLGSAGRRRLDRRGHRRHVAAAEQAPDHQSKCSSDSHCVNIGARKSGAKRNNLAPD
jgi:hypothetical protein